jgi:exosortase/archaeosortase family protein
LNRAYARFLAWIAASSGVAVLAAPNFLPLLSEAVNDAFGTVLPAVPFAALLTILLLLRWGDLRDVLASEKGVTSEVPTRLLGIGIVALLLLLRGLSAESVYLSALVVILSFYGTSLALNPLTWRLVLPYTAIYGAGVVAPALLQWGLGEPLAVLSSLLSAKVIALAGVPLTWYGTQFEFVSKTGDTIAATVTPGCSSIVSVTTFLGLLALMHIDLKKDLSSTIKLALAGVVTLTLLNAIRIAVLVWIGYADGGAAFWAFHNWIGYALFIAFYLVAMTTYSRLGARSAGVSPHCKTPTGQNSVI